MLPETIFAERAYTGFVSHARTFDIDHRFHYPVWMIWARLDSSTLPRLLRPKANRYMSTREILAISRAPGPHDKTTIWLLTQPSLLGRSFNPVSFYCVEQNGTMRAIVAHITNTPWDEQHCYVLDCAQGNAWEFDKAFHVSPFLPMGLRYAWRFELNAERLVVHMRLLRAGACIFSAVLNLVPAHTNPAQGLRLRVSYPLQNLMTIARIYWQAALLKLKGATFYAHPRHNPLRSDHVH